MNKRTIVKEIIVTITGIGADITAAKIISNTLNLEKRNTHMGFIEKAMTYLGAGLITGYVSSRVTNYMEDMVDEGFRVFDENWSLNSFFENGDDDNG